MTETGQRGERARRSGILRYWRSVEYFSPPKVDKVSLERNVVAVRSDRPLPWEADARLGAPRPGCVWQHTVYAGVFEISKMRDVLLDAFRVAEPETDFDGRVSGQTALLSFTVNQEGRLIKESATLSSCAWAVSRTLDPGPQAKGWLDGFDDEADELIGMLLDVGDGRVPVLTSPTSGGGADAPAIAGLAVTLGRAAVKSAIGGLAGAGAAVVGLGPIAGAVAAKVAEDVGGALLDRAGSNRGERQGTNRQGASSDDATVQNVAAPPADLGTKVLGVHDLVAVARWLTTRLGVGTTLEPNAIRIKSRQVGVSRADEAPGDAIMNSFFADDLERVANAVATGEAGKALSDYLTPDVALDGAARIDVRTAPSFVLNAVRPDRMPLGRWPSPSDQPLALSQQFAVNQILTRLGGDDARGLYAVNGPPGTGKTTMLRDLIAAIVVSRAERLAELDTPEKAFVRKPTVWQHEGTPGNKNRRALRPLIPALTGFEMVIASSNNGAVENVTLEVPGKKAVGEGWREEAAYLSEPASLALEDGEAWGAIAARLGRKELRSKFVEAFWWGQRKNGPSPGDGRGLYQLFREHIATVNVGNGSEPALGSVSWPEAVAAFRSARDEVNRLAGDRLDVARLADRLAAEHPDMAALNEAGVHAHQVVQELLDQYGRMETELVGALRAYEVAEVRVAESRTAARTAEAAVRQATEVVETAEESLDQHDLTHSRPGWVRRCFRRGAVADWEAERVPYLRLVEEADAVLEQAEIARDQQIGAVRGRQRELTQHAEVVRVCTRERNAAREMLTGAQAAITANRRDIEVLRRRIENDRHALTEAEARWGASIPGRAWAADPADRAAMEERELSAPWMDEEFAAARTRLFLAALDLHRAVLACAPKTMRANLRAAMDVVKGTAPADLPASTVLAAWQMLFLVVPVVSTTFASVARMFQQLGSESLGWLLVDEAGQASPQEAVGALWRSRKAIVVGDPLQLEPVVTLPLTGQKRLSRHFGVDSQWAPGGLSVQALADRLTPYGTWLSNGEDDLVWVGSPLRVHRRCDRLMFEVSNAIAYDGMMVYGVQGRVADSGLLSRSTWLHVPAPRSGEKWNPEEGRYLRHTVELIAGRIADSLVAEERGSVPDPAEVRRQLAESVFVVSPFRDVAHEIARVTRDLLPKARVGTVHTTQGKEADVVVIVLGTAASAAGSRNWAASAPNLLNVAVTRARQRLLVIGDRNIWSGHRYFSDLARHELLHHAEAAQWRPTET